MLAEVSLRAWIERLERALYDHPAAAAPAVEFENQLGGLEESLVGAFLPGVPGDGGNGAFDDGGELEFEKNSRTFVCALFVPGHDGFLPKTKTKTM